MSGDDLPAARGADFTVREAAPSPALGPERDILVALSQQEAVKAEDAMVTALEGYLDRFQGVTTSRLSGPRARRGTKWWAPSGAAEHKSLLTATLDVETKSLDADYIVPDKLVKEAEAALRPVALRIALDAGYDTAQKLGLGVPDQRGDGMFAVDQTALESAVDKALAQILGSIEGHAVEVRKEILKADSTAESLDEVLNRVEEAHRRGGNWVRLSGRTLANALRNEAAIKAAQAAGCTHMQWVSKRDLKVRPSHVTADGMVRRIDDEFMVGSWFLRFPGDPKDLPASWSELAGCRCSLSFRRPDKNAAGALRLLKAEHAGEVKASALKLLRQATLAPEAAIPLGSPPAPGASRVTLTQPVVAYRALDRVLDAVPGQWAIWPGPLALALAPPAVFSAASPVLAVAIPAGVSVTVVAGTAVLDAGTALEIVGTTPGATQARVV